MARTSMTLQVLYVSSFSLMSPVGVGLGIAISAAATETKGYIVSVAALQGETEHHTAGFVASCVEYTVYYTPEVESILTVRSGGQN